VTGYLALQRALSEDDLAKAQGAASELQESVKKVSFEASAEATKSWEHFSKMIDEHTRHVVQSNSLEEARKAFELLSGNIVMMLRILGNPLDKPLVQAHCPMAAGSVGASWVQEGEKLNNSYFGPSMLECGDVTAEVQPGAHLESPNSELKKAKGPAPSLGHNH
jgi:Cu(I)/Ag(I) efflux system membrane fusion protein